MKKKNWHSAFAGSAAGLANGLFGAGGGMLLVPLLQKNCALDERKCFATALFTMLPLCLVSLLIYLRSGSVDIRSAAPLLAGGFLGGCVGGMLLHRVPVRVLHGIFGGILLWGGIRMWL